MPSTLVEPNRSERRPAADVALRGPRRGARMRWATPARNPQEPGGPPPSSGMPSRRGRGEVAFWGKQGQAVHDAVRAAAGRCGSLLADGKRPSSRGGAPIRTFARTGGSASDDADRIDRAHRGHASPNGSGRSVLGWERRSGKVGRNCAAGCRDCGASDRIDSPRFGASDVGCRAPTRCRRGFRPARAAGSELLRGRRDGEDALGRRRLGAQRRHAASRQSQCM